MQIARQDDGSFVLSELESPLQEILAAIPSASLPAGNAAAEGRLFPEPAGAAEGTSLSEEWREFVKPDLRHLFEEARVTVASDLAQIQSQDGTVLTIIPEHVDAWLNTLNQARLVLAARFELSEADLERPVSNLLETERDLAIFQVHFYGFVQECLLRGMDEED